MLKNLLNSCFDAYRGSHKSVVAGRHIATDISFPTGYVMLTQTLTFLRATACSLFSVSPLKATPTATSRFDELSSTVGSLGAPGRRGRFLRLLAERAKRFTGLCGLMEPLRTSRRTSAFTRTSAHNLCFGGASYE